MWKIFAKACLRNTEINYTNSVCVHKFPKKGLTDEMELAKKATDVVREVEKVALLASRMV